MNLQLKNKIEQDTLSRLRAEMAKVKGLNVGKGLFMDTVMGDLLLRSKNVDVVAKVFNESFNNACKGIEMDEKEVDELYSWAEKKAVEYTEKWITGEL